MAESPETFIKGLLNESIMQQKLGDGTTKDGVEYCPYTKTSQVYDQRRVNPGSDIILGNAVLIGVPINEQRLLDVGCGTGSFLQQMQPYFGEIAGVEYNEGMLGKAAERFGDSSVKLVQGSAQDIPHKDGTYHMVTINQVIHHFSSENDFAMLREALKECFRVLVPGGKLIINTSTPDQQRDAFWWLSLFPEASTKICSRFPALGVLTTAMIDAGFTVNSDGVVVPLKRPLMADEMYLDGGVDLAFDESYRSCDSSWDMPTPEELEVGLEQIRQMKKDQTADKWLAEREKLRVSMGQATFVIATKPRTSNDSEYNGADTSGDSA